MNGNDFNLGTIPRKGPIYLFLTFLFQQRACSKDYDTAHFDDIVDNVSKKFTLDGDVLLYDTETDLSGSDAEMDSADIDALRDLLRDNPEVQVLQVNSSGGSVYAGVEMARIVIDFGLDTMVTEECFSSCVRLFLAGQKRSMMRGAKIGFHQPAWSASSMQSYFEKWQKYEGWDTAFDFGAWVYLDTQTEVYEDLTYMIGRGVDPAFAVRTKGIKNEDRWYPNRLVLSAAGVLRD